MIGWHRFMLKSLGLWKERSDMTPTATARTSPAHTPTSSSPSSTPRGGRKGEESTVSGPTSKGDGDESTLSYTKDTSLLSKDTREDESLFSKDTKGSSSPTSKDFKDISLTSTGHTRDSSLPTTLREASLTWQEHESSLLLNANDESLPSRASEPLPGSSPSHYLPLSEGSQTPQADTDPDLACRQRAGSEAADYRRPWLPGQHARHSSLVSQVPGGAETTKPRTSSLVVRPEHRRHLSEGSRVSFSQRAPSLTSHCTHISQPSQSGASDSVHVTCAACNLQALRDLQKPDFEEVKENLQQLPKIAKGG